MRCRNCVLDSEQQGIAVSGTTGLCRFCEGYVPPSDEQRAKNRDLMDAILAREGVGAYDAVVALSGGKDSSYALVKLAREYPDVRILAVQFDNGYISPVAFENAKAVCSTAGADYCGISFPRGVMERVFAAAAVSREVYPPAARIRASDICNTCINIVKQAVIGQALLHGAPAAIFAFTPGQTEKPAIRLSGTTIRSFRTLFSRQLEQLGLAGDAPRLLVPPALLDAGREVAILHPYTVWHYDEAEILSRLPGYGWKPPKIDDPNSTNCLINAAAITNHIKKYGIHPYAFDIAGMVRAGLLTREEGLRRLEEGFRAARDGEERGVW